MSYLSIVVGIVMAIVAMCSIIGNSLVFLVICWNQSLKKPLNLFLFNLAIADIGISCTCIPYAIGQVVFITSGMNLTLCYVNGFIVTLFVGASSMVIMAFCFYQFLMVSGPADSSVSPLQSSLFLCMAWILALALSIAPLFGLGDYELSWSIFECVFPNKSGHFQKVVYNGLLMALWYTIPFLSLVIFYLLIIIHLRDPDIRTAKGCVIASVANDDGCLETGQSRAARAVFFICLVFVVFRTPLFMSIVFSTWSLVGSSWLSLTDQIAFWGIYFHAAMDPFVYALQHGEFTHTVSVIWRLLQERFIECCCCCCNGNVEEGEKLFADKINSKKVSLDSITEEE